jgi:hypothetical protein
MPYTIPNEATAGFLDQAEPDQRDIEILTAGISHGTGGSNYGVGPTGVQSGCAVTAQGSPDMTVAVAAGVVRIGGRRVVVSAGNVTITTADGTNPRFDLIVVDTAAAKTAIAGTPAPTATVVFPAITAGRVVLAAVYVPASDTAINTNQITDKRVMIDTPPYENVKWYGALGDDSTNDQAAIQAAVDNAFDVAAATGRSRTVFFPSGAFRVNTTVTLQEGIRLEGVGKPSQDSRYGSFITSNVSSMSVFTVPDDATLRQNGFHLRNLGICAVAGQTNVIGLEVWNMNRWVIEDCAFVGGDVDCMAIGIKMRLNGGGMDSNWQNLVNTEFRMVKVCIDAYNTVGLSARGCHFMTLSSQTAGFIGFIGRADASGTTQNVRFIDCEFVFPTNGIGIHYQGVHGKFIGCHFEGITSSTGNIGIKLEKVGAQTNSGRRNEIIGCSVIKTGSGGTGIEIGTGCTQTNVIGVDYITNTTNFTDNGTETNYFPAFSGEFAKLATSLDWPVVTAPATPGTGYQRFYVDTADGIFKSKDSAGVVSIYGARARSLFIDASMLRLDAAQGVKIGTPPNAVDAVSLADGILSGGYCNFNMPVDVIAGTVTIRPQWAPGATDGTAHTVRWQMNIRIVTGADVTAAGTTVAWTGVSAARTVNVEVLETGQASTGVSPAANDRIRLEIQRDGAHANDTYVGAVQLLGICINYQANN